MTRGLLLVSLAAGALMAPVPASAAATELAIRSITVRPAQPVVGPGDSVRLVIDVVAKGARGRNGVTVKVEPGAPPGPLLISKTPAAVPAPPAEPPSIVTRPGGASTRPIQPQPVHQQPPAQPQPIQGDQPVQAAKPAQAGQAAQAAQPGTRPAAGVPLIEGPATVVKAGAGPAKHRPAALPPRLVWRLAAPDAPAAARLAGDWQTWRFLPDKRLSRYYPTGTWTVTATATGKNGATVTEYASFEFKRETRFAGVRAEQAKSGAVRLRGSLTRVDPRGLVDYGPFGKQPVEILWRPDTATAWERAGTATTDAAGAFTATVRGRTGGHWRARYTGTAHYAADISKSWQVAR